MQPPLENARQTPRVHFFDRVRVFIENRRVEAFGLDVSEMGMRLRSNEAVPAGTHIALEFSTGSGPVRVEEAEVVWAQPYRALHIQGRYPGFGVRFLTVDPDAQENLSAFLAAATPLPRPGFEEPPQLAMESAPMDLDVVVEEAAGAEPENAIAEQPTALELRPAEIVLPGPSEEPLPTVVVAAFEPDLQVTVIEPPPSPSVNPRRPDVWSLPWRAARATAGAAVVVGLLWLGVATRDADASASSQSVATPAMVEKLRLPIVGERAEAVRTAPEAGDEGQDLDVSDSNEPEESPAESAPAVEVAANKRAVAGGGVEEDPESGSAGDRAADLPRSVVPSPEVPPIAKGHPPGTIDVRREKDGWVLVVWHRKGLRTRAFGLSGPPRYVIDVFDSDAPPAPAIDPHVESVSEIRTNPRDGFVRYVVDFTGTLLPGATVFRDPGAVSVRFR